VLALILALTVSLKITKYYRNTFSSLGVLEITLYLQLGVFSVLEVKILGTPSKTDSRP